MLSCQKDLFSLDPAISYLNCAYMAPSTKAVEAAGIAGVKAKNQPWKLGVDDFFKPVEELKATFAKLIQARDPQRVTMIPSVSYGIANAAANLHPRPHQHIVLVEGQFPSNVFSWQKLAARVGCGLTLVPAPEGKDRGKRWNRAILDAIDPQTAIVAMAPLDWGDGTLFDLKKIRAKTAEYGAALILDGTQAIGATPFDVEKLQPDALIVAGYKWLLGPYGLGMAWYGPRFDEGLPIENNWIHRRNSDQFATLSDYEGSYRPGAQRYGMGEISNFVTIPMLQQGMEHLLEWGVENIQQYCKTLVDEPLKQLVNKGVIIEEEAYRSSHLFGLKLPKEASMDDILNKIGKAGVKVSLRGNSIRVSPHVYNDQNDMDMLVDCIQF
jgi:selenocysteine lyase/cysteine desulfurase